MYRSRHIQNLKEQNPELKNIGKIWKKSEDKELLEMLGENITIKDIAKHFSRTIGAIYCRTRLLTNVDYQVLLDL